MIDEIVGGRQFEKLCKENSTIQVDRVKATGKTVYLADLPDIQIDGTWVPVRLQPWHYVDATTGELVVSFNIFHATGGRFIRTLGISEGKVPLSFDGYCAPGGSRSHAINLFKELGITDIERPTQHIGSGVDTLCGGKGDDLYILAETSASHQGSYDNAGLTSSPDNIIELAGEGHDSVLSVFDHTLGDNLEDLTLAGHWNDWNAVSWAVKGTGNSLDNKISGNAGFNILNGRTGNDTLVDHSIKKYAIA